MVRDLLNGKVKLVIVYWLYGVLIGFCYQLVYLYIDSHFVNLIMYPHGTYFLYAFIIFPFLYFPFIYYAIWRSADRYRGRRIWAILAKLVVCLGTVILIVNACIILRPLLSTTISTSQLANQIAVINKSLPILIDTETEFTHAGMEGNNIVYHYTLINQSVTQLDTAKFGDLMKIQLTPTVCTNTELKKAFASGIGASFEYVDKNGTPVTQVMFKPGDCPPEIPHETNL